MSAITLQGNGFTDAHIRSFKRAIALYGQDELASGIEPRRVTPYVAADYALEVARFWLQVAPACVRRALEGADPDHPWLVVTNAAESTTWVHKAMAEKAIERLRAGELVDDETMRIIGARSPLAAGILRDLQSMFHAIRDGWWDASSLFGRTGTGGRPVMGMLSGRYFWDHARSCANGCGGSTASVTAEEKWDTFTAAVKENARAVAEKAGEAAGFIASTAGQAIGSGVGGFFSELGVVQTALLGGGLFLAWKVL